MNQSYHMTLAKWPMPSPTVSINNDNLVVVQQLSWTLNTSFSVRASAIFRTGVHLIFFLGECGNLTLNGYYK